jgi:DNA helicase-2/ATP-dependent DNA helicase PcrA
MQWDTDLLDDQKRAACNFGCHARLLAGPGTGKTLTLARRAAYLVAVRGISPNQILAVTFTRAAAFELFSRIADVLNAHQDDLPRVSTLHSFALRQLLRNSDRIESIPRPLRIADDWEERNIILEDLKVILNYDLRIVRERFNLLSADWQTLVADEEEWERSFSDPRFLGAWRQHREVFGYALRSELVYQLKRALEQTEEFSFESNYLHLLVDEYQDLNRCDLAVISAIRDKGVEVFGAGDDDQSIYGFRYAHPEGIRRFDRDYIPSSSLTLGTCVRCDRSIIDLSLFVANLDPTRLEKPLQPRDDAGDGEVYILRFKNQTLEAKGVAKICKYLLDRSGYGAKDILILMRSDRYGVFSSMLREALEAQNVPVAVRVEGTPLDILEGRIFLSVLHLLADNNDSLALRTLLMLRDNRIGKESYTALYDLARNNGETFSGATRKVMVEPELIPHLGRRIASEMREIQNILDRHRVLFESLADSLEPQDLLCALRNLADDIIQDEEKRAEVLQFLESIVAETNSTNHVELLRVISSSLEDEEQELDSESVNIMTMHKAKGLTASAVIIIAAEDEYIPGRQIGDREGDERRLLYVSLSRARHFLLITYCERRTGRQKHTGRTSGQSRRTLTQFLRDAPVVPINGESFVEQLGHSL